MLRERVFEIIEGAGRKGFAWGPLVDALEGATAPEELERVLEELESDGRVVHWNRRWRALRFTDWSAGRVQVLKRGDGLIRSGDGGEAGFFVRRRDLAGARDGDAVLVRPLKRGRGGKHKPGDLPRAVVVKRLAPGVTRIVGTLAAAGRGRTLVPFDPKLALEIEVAAGDGEMGDYVVVELDAEDDLEQRPRGGRPRGRVVEVLGPVSVPGVDVLVLLRHLQIPETFPPEVLAAAENLPPDPEPSSWTGREDLRERVTVTIDGGTARDFDDAISVARDRQGNFELGVHIADVSHYVREGGAIDQEAYRRGTSVYFPDRAVPMIPESLSNGLCSLRPEVPRLTLSAFLVIDRQGKVLRRRFARSVIRSRRRLTYQEVATLLAQPDREVDSDYAEVLPLLRDAHQLMRALHQARLERGSIDFDLPHGDVILDTDGYTVGVRPGQRNDAHRLIEEFMIAANEAVALELDGREAPALYRVHDPPAREALSELREVLRTLAIDLPGDLASLHPSALQEALARVAGRPEEGFVSSLVLRSMQRAVYDPVCSGHYALAGRHYTHFTSPIRRYPDLLVHRQLKKAIDGRLQEGADTLSQRLPAIAESCSWTERRAEQAERMILQWKLVRLLADRIGEEFDGRVTGVQPFGLFVQLSEFFVDGLVPIYTLADDYYEYDQASHHLVGRDKGRVFRLADELRVVLTGVDERRRGLDLAIVGMPQAPPRPERNRRDRRPKRARR